MKQSANRRPRSLMSPLPECSHTTCAWSAHSAEYVGGPPIASARYAASRGTCSGFWSACEKG